MTFSISRGRKALASLATAAVVAVSMAPTTASAGWHGHHGHGHGYGYGAAALGGGLLLGALAANAYNDRVVYERRCWTERRRVVNYYGDSYVRRIRVCE